jgi:hypothetical protein
MIVKKQALVMSFRQMTQLFRKNEHLVGCPLTFSLFEWGVDYAR